ncbi:MAG: hypothetical protein TIS_02934 [Tissierella sp.]
MYHSRCKGSYYEARLRYGNILRKKRIILIQDKIYIFFIEPLDFVGGLINFCGML